MRFRIRHSLHYRYEREVFLEPMTLRLFPRRDSSQRLLQHRMRIEAEPTGSTTILEPDGHEAMVLWFDDRREGLDLVAEMEVETLRSNPFDWIVTDPSAARLPAAYGDGEAASLAPNLAAPVSGAVASPGGVDPQVAAWAAEQAAAVDHRTTAFLMHLADAIHHGFHHVGRPDGDPMTSAETLATRSGACRDTAMLYVEACRSLGLAARFVSGYSIHHPPEVSEQELHAWAEVYVPGGGWRGYDPSLGLAVGDGHVVLAAAPDHRLAAPVTGSYRGTGVASTMTYQVRLSAE